MGNAFTAAAAKAPAGAASKSKKSQNIVEVRDDEVGAAIDELVAAHGRIKAAETDKSIASSTALPHCLEKFLADFAAAQRKPSTMKFRSEKGNTVTLVVQDRGERYDVSEEQHATILAILGKKKTEDIILRDMTFSFNNAILNKPGVMDALGEKIGELVASGILTGDEAGSLLEANHRMTVRKGVVDDLGKLCDNDPDQMKTLLEALGSHSSAYVKP